MEENLKDILDGNLNNKLDENYKNNFYMDTEFDKSLKIVRNLKNLKKDSLSKHVKTIKEHEVYFYPPQEEGHHRPLSVAVFKNIIYTSDMPKKEILEILNNEVVKALARAFKKNEKVDVEKFISDVNAKYPEIGLVSISSIEVYKVKENSFGSSNNGGNSKSPKDPKKSNNNVNLVSKLRLNPKKASEDEDTTDPDTIEMPSMEL